MAVVGGDKEIEVQNPLFPIHIALACQVVGRALQVVAVEIGLKLHRAEGSCLLILVIIHRQFTDGEGAAAPLFTAAVIDIDEVGVQITIHNTKYTFVIQKLSGIAAKTVQPQQFAVIVHPRLFRREGVAAAPIQQCIGVGYLRHIGEIRLNSAHGIKGTEESFPFKLHATVHKGDALAVETDGIACTIVGGEGAAFAAFGKGSGIHRGEHLHLIEFIKAIFRGDTGNQRPKNEQQHKAQCQRRDNDLQRTFEKGLFHSWFLFFHQRTS